MGMIPKRTKTNQQFSLGIFNVTLGRIIGLVVTVMISSAFTSGMTKAMAICFIAFSVVSYLFLTKRAPSDPTKLYWQGLIDFLLYLVFPKTYYSHESKEFKITAQRKEEKMLAKKERKKKQQKGKAGKEQRAS